MVERKFTLPEFPFKFSRENLLFPNFPSNFRMKSHPFGEVSVHIPIQHITRICVIEMLDLICVNC